MKFEVAQMKVAREMIRLNCQCVGAILKPNGLLNFLFERNEETTKAYRQARKNLGLDK